MNKKSMMRLLGITLLSIMFIYLAGCQNEDSKGTEGTSKDSGDEPFKISIMTKAHTPQPPKAESPALKAIEEYTNTKLDINFVPASNYNDRFNITLGSTNLPSIILADRGPSFIQAAQDGAFWDLTEYLSDYENLSQINGVVAHNISIDGSIFGIPSQRNLVRNAVTIREDWLDNLGLEVPQTIEDFYEVLKAFTNDDPDGNGKNDTYGIVISEFAGPWDTMQIWFGVPNKWGIDNEDKLYPHFQDPQYKVALDFFKKIYDEGLVNEDFAVMDSSNWGDPFVNGEAGVIIDTPGRSTRSQEVMVRADPSLESVVGLFTGVEGPKGLFHLPSTGYGGIFSIPKSTVSSEDELYKILDFMDKMNTEEGQRLAGNGIEGIHYEIKDGQYVPTVDESLRYEYTDLNQLLMFLPEDRSLVEMSPEKEREREVIGEFSDDTFVANPAEPLVSQVYAQRGAQLDNIIGDARIQYIVGQIDESGLDDAEALWLRSGGQDLIDEMNELYEEIQ